MEEGATGPEGQVKVGNGRGTFCGYRWRRASHGARSLSSCHLCFETTNAIISYIVNKAKEIRTEGRELGSGLQGDYQEGRGSGVVQPSKVKTVDGDETAGEGSVAGWESWALGGDCGR
jgi:hypothetical protein